MKTTRLLVLLSLCLVSSLFAQAAKEDVRVSQLLNFGWKFYLGEVRDGQSVTCNNANWRVLDLPHDFQIEQGWDQSAGGARGFKAMGIGWYRKSFMADPE